VNCCNVYFSFERYSLSIILIVSGIESSNFIRPHQSLNGETPAQKAGTNLGYEQNKWKEIITKAHQPPKVIKKEKRIEYPEE
jgi:hypothetical protein